MVYTEVITAFAKNYKSIPQILRAVWSIVKSDAKSTAFPLRVQIENSTVCNLSCQMCPLPSMTRSRGFMNFQQFKKIYDILQSPFLNLTGYGESFLNKDIFKMVKYAKQKGAFVKFDSNGTLLDDKNIAAVLNYGLDLLSFSLDGATAKTYEKIRRGSDFKKVIKGINDLVKERNKRKSQLQIHLAMVVQIDNVAELVDLIKLGEKLGVDKINPTPVVDYDLPKNKQFLLDRYKNQLKKTVNDYEKIQSQLKTKVDIEPLLDFLLDKNEHHSRICFIPWYSVYISWQGDVFPCCYYYNGQINFGNIFQKPFAQIWNSPAYQKFRETLRDNRTKLLICSSCTIDEKFLANKIKTMFQIPGLALISKRKF